MAERISGRPENRFSGRPVCVVLKGAGKGRTPLVPFDLSAQMKAAGASGHPDGIARALTRLEWARSAIDDELARLRRLQAKRVS